MPPENNHHSGLLKFAKVKRGDTHRVYTQIAGDIAHSVSVEQRGNGGAAANELLIAG